MQRHAARPNDCRPVALDLLQQGRIAKSVQSIVDDLDFETLSAQQGGQVALADRYPGKRLLGCVLGFDEKHLDRILGRVPPSRSLAYRHEAERLVECRRVWFFNKGNVCVVEKQGRRRLGGFVVPHARGFPFGRIEKVLGHKSHVLEIVLEYFAELPWSEFLLVKRIPSPVPVERLESVGAANKQGTIRFEEPDDVCEIPSIRRDVFNDVEGGDEIVGVGLENVEYFLCRRCVRPKEGDILFRVLSRSIGDRLCGIVDSVNESRAGTQEMGAVAGPAAEIENRLALKLLIAENPGIAAFMGYAAKGSCRRRRRDVADIIIGVPDFARRRQRLGVLGIAIVHGVPELTRVHRANASNGSSEDCLGHLRR